MTLIIGSGRTAQHFSHYFQKLGIPLSNWNRRDHSLQQLYEQLSVSSRVVLLISDSAIEGFIEKYLQDYAGTVFHMSGAMEFPTAISLHPLMTFGETLYELSFYQKIPFVLLKNRKLQDFFPELPNPSFDIRAEDKGKYHALCVLSGNFTTLLWLEAFRGFEKMGLPRSVAFPFLQKTAENLTNQARPLTGPLARKDVSTVDANLDSLEGEPGEKIYRAFLKTYFSEYPQ